MHSHKARRLGARTLIAIAAAGLTHSTPGLAEVDPNLVAAVEQAVDPLPQPAQEEEAAAATLIGEGTASYYGAELAGNRTASGERFNPHALTAAHRSLPLGSKVRVTNKANGRSVVVRINDRGPFHKGRLIDLSLGAAKEIAMVRAGEARVRIHRIA